MRIVEPWIKVEKIDGKKIMKRLERACRTCYRSEGKITDDSYKKLLTNCITRGHESVLEHEKVTVRIYDDVGSYKDLTRHRFASFSVESTRYCSYDKDKYGNEETYDCDGTHEFQKPLAVLVNGYSASASEIFAGAVKDYGIGTLVGTTTFGKGIVQELFSFEDDTMIKITTAEYFTPSGENLHKKGIHPDVEVEYSYDAAMPERDPQLEKALEIVKGGF